ncbi:alpha/beta fold hydrolase [Sphingomonas sp. Mn802worker]|uniref:alpha/beta fold hydrolase n=1 Tax=Sphingomonas sp. Mn802worker TaxID=629773 RepID=UPI0012E993C8|nr:alpha/beta hydrolase [Sphingomonas sp. Mn802worker]
MTANTAVSGAMPIVRKGYVTVDGRLVHYRYAGAGPALVMLHDSPRSSRLHIATMTRLAAQFRVFALDTPGYGGSAPLPDAVPTIAEFGVALEQALEAMGLSYAPLYATHTSAKIALDYAARTNKPSRLILDGLSIPLRAPDADFIAAYMRPFELDDAGAYLAREWTRLRDMLRWFPWFSQTPPNRMAIDARSDAWIADYAIDLLSAGPSYSSAYAAAMRYDPMPALQAVRCPTVIAARTDDVLYASLDRVPADANSALTVVRLPADDRAWYDWLAEAAAGGPDVAPLSQLHGKACYVDLPYGQMLVHRGNVGGGRPLLILEAPTTLHARRWQAAFVDRETIVPELPGYGDSDALPAPSVDALVEAIGVMLDGLGHERVDVVATGFATPIAAAFAAARTDRVGSLVLDGCLGLDDERRAEIAAAICPAIEHDRAGAHLHRIWHMLRDGEAQWPWFDDAPTAHRALSPTLHAEALHPELLAILKQPERYGDATRAAIKRRGDARYPVQPRPTLVFTRDDDPAYSAASAVAATLPHARMVERAPEIAAAAEQARAFLDAPVDRSAANISIKASAA